MGGRPRRDWASVDEIAEQFGIGKRTVRRHIAEGRLRAYRVGRLIRIDVAEAEATLLRPMVTTLPTVQAPPRFTAGKQR